MYRSEPESDRSEPEPDRSEPDRCEPDRSEPDHCEPESDRDELAADGHTLSPACAGSDSVVCNVELVLSS